MWIWGQHSSIHNMFPHTMFLATFKTNPGVPFVVQQKWIQLGTMRFRIWSLFLAQWVKDLVLPWAVVWVADAAWIPCCCRLWYGPAAVALVGPLAWEHPYATNAALKRKKKGLHGNNLNVHWHMDGLKNVVHIHNGILLSHKKNKIMLFAATWMQIEILMLSELRQKEKDKYYMISFICGF